MGSEPGVGWNTALEVAKHHDVWCITRSDNRSAIEAELARNPIPSLQFVYHDMPERLRWWRRGSRGVQVHYYLWQAAIYTVARRLHLTWKFDALHHVTYVRYWTPSFISLLGVPFVWGPIGGGESAPSAFRREFSTRGRCYELLRDFARWLGEHDPFLRLTVRRATVALATTRETEARLRRLGASNVLLMGESGLGESDLDQLTQLADTPTQLRFLSVGRLLHWKGYHLSIRAFAEASLPDAEYCLIGDGPERAVLQELARSLGVAERVRFLGQLPRWKVLEHLGQCSVFVHPSLHDSGGWACLEAMAAAKPVVCLDIGGPGVQVTRQSGIKIAALAPDQAIRDMASALRTLAEDGFRRQNLGQCGRQRVRELFSWESKGRSLNELYEEVVR